MDYYQEITLIDQAEISPYFLWSKIYMQLHFALVEMKDQHNQVPIGISFPDYVYETQENKKPKVSLGGKLRIFAISEIDLQKLDIRKWLDRLLDYTHITSIRPVPESRVTGYAIYRRKQVKTNPQRLARHRVKRGDIGFDEALARYSNVVTTTDLPYIQLQSLSTSDEQNKRWFKLFIEKKSAEKSETQVFSTYGLSSQSSVPEF
ncbi:type I-F CRISPR-associated endoribonuclease Cas6/Csy4 [Acinetobacter sp. SWAC57]|uniref:type I-F CRISPR-associated endoribonuclease Cas6/Csy4 n=1 Tax=Acinetobacter sp. SWAC57 TaxID=2293834 RepID=UPI000E5C0B4C|nr:type I-F CRISPR-associated endoribonuclease Cas6/Csy4 [Acinetobacter sp. SWAC57]RGD89216.1 type I-F CRISPR-associated endoribonuclease Cas6/Csy4 [Acinetobacter sp. SWAC57]